MPTEVAARSVTAYIGGQRYVIKSDADDTYVRRLAEVVDQKLEDVRDSTRALPENKLLVLTALNIADELMQEKKRQAELKRRVQNQTKEVLTDIERWQKKHRRDSR